jgi:hypothetical protein
VIGVEFEQRARSHVAFERASQAMMREDLREEVVAQLRNVKPATFAHRHIG